MALIQTKIRPFETTCVRWDGTNLAEIHALASAAGVTLPAGGILGRNNLRWYSARCNEQRKFWLGRVVFIDQFGELDSMDQAAMNRVYDYELPGLAVTSPGVDELLARAAEREAEMEQQEETVPVTVENVADHVMETLPDDQSKWTATNWITARLSQGYPSANALRKLNKAQLEALPDFPPEREGFSLKNKENLVALSDESG